MPIIVTGELGETIISGSVLTVSASHSQFGPVMVNTGKTIISGSIITGSTGYNNGGSNPKIGVPFGDDTITGSLPYLTTTGSLVMAEINGQDGCWELYINMPTGSSPNTDLKWVLLTSSCP